MHTSRTAERFSTPSFVASYVARSLRGLPFLNQWSYAQSSEIFFSNFYPSTQTIIQPETPEGIPCEHASQKGRKQAMHSHHTLQIPGWYMNNKNPEKEIGVQPEDPKAKTPGTGSYLDFSTHGDPASRNLHLDCWELNHPAL